MAVSESQTNLAANKRKLKYEANNVVVLVTINVTLVNVKLTRKWILDAVDIVNFFQNEEKHFKYLQETKWQSSITVFIIVLKT